MTDTRIDDLRACFPAHGLDGYLVPRGDEHLGEDVPPSSERLAFLSGFTGSAGLAIVLMDTATLFTDGRYMIQVRDETGPGWDSVHMVQNPPGAWLRALGRTGLRIGYDPMLVASEVLERLAGTFGTLVPVVPNLVDAIWQDRPAAPETPVQIQDAVLAGRTVDEKLRLVADTLRIVGEDVAVLSDPASVCWMLNLRASDLPYTPALLAHALVRRDGTATLFVHQARLDKSVRAHLGPAVLVLPPAAMRQVVAELAGQRVRIDPVRTPAWFKQTLTACQAQISLAVDPCLMPRACKTPPELDAFRDAHRHDGVALCRFLRWVVADGVGQSEHAASERLLAFRRDASMCSGASFASISATGSNTALMHYRPSKAGSAPLQANALFLIDSGGQYPGATTDVTRTIWLGVDTPPAVLRDQFTRVLQGMIGLTEAVFPDGASGHRLDMLTRLALWRGGYDFDHGAGHGLGSQFAVHEWPSAFASSPPGGPVHCGMVLTNEPGYYLPGSHGIRIENAMVVEVRATGGDRPCCGFETLTLAPIDRVMIDQALLTAVERDWVDAYHARVAREIGPRLDPEDRAWLENCCAPLVSNAS